MDECKKIYNEALNKYGFENQKWVLIEECGELFDVLAKLKRGRSTRENIISELADVHIMVEQMAYFFGWEYFLIQKKYKLQRLKERLNKES